MGFSRWSPALGRDYDPAHRLAGKVLADHPDQRKQVVEDRTLVVQNSEEILRFAPTASQVGRYVARDGTLRGRTVAEVDGHPRARRRHQP